jgi:hypothetical protein
MYRSEIQKGTNRITCRLSSYLFCFVLVGGITRCTCTEAMSTSAQSSTPSTGWTSAGSSTAEITVLGTIQQVVSDHVAGSPAGIHILINSPLGPFDASLGSFLPSEVRQALSNGEQVQITGIVHSANGKDYLLARQLKVAGHQVNIRNANGFLIHNPSSTGSRPDKVHSAPDGDMQ